jgi:hypothetical protein
MNPIERILHPTRSRTCQLQTRRDSDEQRRSVVIVVGRVLAIVVAVMPTIPIAIPVMAAI